MDKQAVTFGEVMMRLSVPEFGRFTQAQNLNIVYGGAEANVSISLAHFGISASHNKIHGLLWNGKTLLRSREHDLTHIVDRLGAGDAFMAGLIYGWMKKLGDQQTLEFATAASALKHSVEGDANLATVEEVEALVKDENTGKLLR